MRLNQRFRPPRHLLMLFLVTTLVLALALGWLSWRLLQQDRALESQRIQERLQQVAEIVVAALLRNLSEVEEQLTTLSALTDTQLANAASQSAKGLADGALIVVFHPLVADVYPGNRLLYYPLLAKQNEPPVPELEREAKGLYLDLHNGRGTFLTDRVVDTHITNLRKKIEPQPSRPRYLISVRGIGYRFDG